MENVEVKGTKKKAKAEASETPVRKKKVKAEKPLSVVEADRTEPSGYLKAQIRKMSKEQKETAVKFMIQRNEARVKAQMEPAYSQEDMDLYK